MQEIKNILSYSIKYEIKKYLFQTIGNEERWLSFMQTTQLNFNVKHTDLTNSPFLTFPFFIHHHRSTSALRLINPSIPGCRPVPVMCLFSYLLSRCLRTNRHVLIISILENQRDYTDPHLNTCVLCVYQRWQCISQQHTHLWMPGSPWIERNEQSAWTFYCCSSQRPVCLYTQTHTKAHLQGQMDE